MEKIFRDTSAIFALVNTAEVNNLIAWDTWDNFGDEVELVSSR